MRRRILDTTLASLASAGWAGTTTSAVVEAAGISRGALLHHYPTRTALIAAAVADLYGNLRRDFENAFATLPPGADRLARALELLWEIYCRPELEAVLELDVAARVDIGLRRELARVATEHHALVVELARRSFPEITSPRSDGRNARRRAARRERFDLTLDLVLATLQGMAVRRAVRPDADRERRALTFLHDVVADAIAGAVSEHSA